MRKILLMSCLVLVLASGCLESRKNYKVIYDQAASEITVRGRNVDASNLVRKMIAANGWKHESAGSSSHSSNSLEVINGIKIKRKKTNTVDSYIVARAHDGKAIRFDVHTENDNKATVKISVDGDKTADVSKYETELLSWLGNNRGDSRERSLKLTVHNPQQDPQDSNLFTGDWTAAGRFDSEYVEIEINYEIADSQAKQHLNMHRREFFGESELLGSVKSCQIKMPGGMLTFNSDHSLMNGLGKTNIHVDPAYLKAIAKACSDVNDTSNADTILRILFSRIDPAFAGEIATAIGKPLKLDEVIKLSNYHVAADYVKAFVDAGYDFDVKGLVKLKQYRITPEYAAEFKTAGFDFGVSELIKLKNYRIKSADAAGFKRAGYDFGVDELVKAGNYRLGASYAEGFKDAGYNFTLGDLIKLSQYRITAEDAAMFKQAGYNFGTSELIKAKNYRLSADYSAKLKNAGYDFSLEELIKLKQYNVSMDFMIKVADAEYENFTAAELIDMRNKNISADTIVKLRKKKQKKAENAVSSAL